MTTAPDRLAVLPATGTPRAVWLLDIDGVLNALSGRCTGWPRQARAALRTFGGGVTEIRYAPDLMHLLTELHRRRLVEFRWSTTWEDHAPAVFTPLVGLDVGDRIAGRADGEEPWWKLRAFRRACAEPGPVVIWTEDEIPQHRDAATFVAAMQRSGRALVLPPDPAVGLTPGDVDRILDVLSPG